MTNLRYKPHVTRAIDEDGSRLQAWDIYSNPYSRRSEMRRPTFSMAMKVCAALQKGVDEEDLTFRFDDFIVIFDGVLRQVEGKLPLPEFGERMAGI